MFDFSWSELLLIGIVALVFIGPKELPGVLRMLGQWMSKVRRMAGEFQNQFHDAMREAELADLKKEVEQMNAQVSNYSIDPLADVHRDVEMARRDIESAMAGSALEGKVTANEATVSQPAETEATGSAKPAVAEPTDETAAPVKPVEAGSAPI
jgi:sec-independent protein translocase protein TatB